MKKLFIVFVFLGFYCNLFSQYDNQILQIDSLVKSYYKSYEPGVVVLIAKNGEIVLRKAYGMANMELNIPLLPTHVFKIASITKPFTALAIFDLVENKRLDLNDSITKYLPQLDRKFGSVSIKHLLSHTSGIISYDKTEDFENLYSKYYFNFINEGISGDSIFKIINKYDLQNIPGESFSYCNSGYFFLEKIIEIVSGMPFEKYMEDKIFEPIEMGSTEFYGVTKLIKNRVAGYTDFDSTIVNNPHTCLEGIITKGPAGMVSCVDDLFLWYKAIMHNGYFKQISFKYYTPPFILNDLSESVYSMGFFSRKLKGNKTLNHNGDASGFSSSMLILPDDSIFIVFLGNNDLYSKGSSRYHENIAKRIAAILVNDPFPNYKSIILTDENLKKLQGVYVTEDNVERRVFLEESKIYIQRNNGRKVQIYPYATNKFYFEGNLNDLSFNEDEYGKISSLTMNFDDGRKITAIKISDDNLQHNKN